MIDWMMTITLTAAAILPPLAVYVFCRGAHPAVTWLVAAAAIAAHIAAWQVIDNAAAAWLLIGYEVLGPIFGLGILIDLFREE